MSANGVIRPPATVAVIGLGTMGQPMAAHLVKAGFEVRGFDISERSRTRFAEAGGRTAQTLADTVTDAEAVITLLPDGKIVREVANAIRPDLKPQAILIDMSSSDPIGTRSLGQEFISAGFGFLDAPVSGGVRRAIQGTLAIMAGGAPETIHRVEQILVVMGSPIFHTGPLGSGHAMKALNNYVSSAGLIAAIEAVRIGRAFGLDPSLMIDVLNASTGMNNSTEHKLKQFVISETFDSGFLLSLMAKDVRIADDLATAVDVATPLADLCAAILDEASRNLGPDADHTAIGEHLKALRR